MELNDQKELFSLSLATAVCSQAGCNWSFSIQDFGIDLLIIGESWEFNPHIGAQVKATSDMGIIREDQGIIKYKLRAKNYRDLIKNTHVPRILLLAIMPKDPTIWCKPTNYQIACQYGIYWYSLEGLPKKENSSSVTIEIPLENRFDLPALKGLMEQMMNHGGLST